MALSTYTAICFLTWTSWIYFTSHIILASVSQVIRVTSVLISRLSLSCCMYQPSHTTCCITAVMRVIQVGVPTVSSKFCSFLQSAFCFFTPVLSWYKPHENCLCSLKILVLFVVSVIYLQNVHICLLPLLGTSGWLCYILTAGPTWWSFNRKH